MTAHKFVVWFHEVDRNDVHLVGGKGANLGEMVQARLPVPLGFVVTAPAYFYFLEKAKLKPKIKAYLANLDYNDPRALDRISKAIQKDIIHAPIPKEISNLIIKYYLKLKDLNENDIYHLSKRGRGVVENLKKLHRQVIKSDPLVAVRSSATAEDLPEASFAGQQETFLNIKGEANVVEAVRKAWASLFTPRAIFYRNEHDFDHFKVGIAVPIQKMVESETSGVMFTIDPVSNEKDKIIIEAIYGLGELIVQGQVTPDHYVVEKKSLKILNKEINKQKVYIKGTGKKSTKVDHYRENKQKITDEQIVKLARLGKRIEEHYYFPQDIEWAVAGGKVYILQTRPVTTLGGEMPVKQQLKDQRAHRLKEKLLLTGDVASPGMVSGKVVIIKSAREIHKVEKGDILVAQMTNPDFVPAMKKAVAIVTEKGGRTSHAAIVSRELGLPCIVGAQGAMRVLKNGMEITVDGGEGKVYEGIRSNVKGQMSNQFQISKSKSQTIKTATKVYVNLAEESRAEEVAKMNVDGVGLLRAEFMLAEIGVHPKQIIKERKQKVFISKLAKKIEHICCTFSLKKPIVYRTTDFKTNEYRNLRKGNVYENEEENPMIGYRGTYRYINDPEVFEMELAAIRLVRQKMGWRNLWVMLPFVRSPGELREAKKIMAAAGLMRSPSFKLWMMVELPVNVILLEDFIKIGIDGVSIGSNDLTQLILGLDRDNEKVAKIFNEKNPAVLWALEKTIKTAHKYKITSSICGQAPSDYSDLVEKLVKWGITSVSVNPDAIGKVRDVIYKAEQKIANREK